MQIPYNVKSSNGKFVINTCEKCKREWDCTMICIDYICDDCDESPNYNDEEQSIDRDQK